MSAPRPNTAPASIERDFAATLALTVYSLTVAVGFARVFSGWDFLADMALLVVIGHGVSFGLRRARISGWLAIPFIGALLAWLLIALHYGDTLTYLVPRSESWHQIDLEISVVRDQFQTAIAPVLYGAGWATLACFALIVVVVMADAFAFRAEARGEALVPGGVLFVFIAALGSSRLRITATVLLIAAGIVAVVALRSLHDRSRRVELISGRGPISMIVPTAVATAVGVAVIAGFVGPRVPGADAEPLYDTRGRGGGVTNVISPLVDIRSRLTNRGNVELFRVNADQRAYWRVTTLPEFDGRTFRLPRRPLERFERVESGASGTGRLIRQEVQVLALGGRLVPAAADPFQAEGTMAEERVSLNLNPDTSTLVAPDEMSPGDQFTVVSDARDLSPEILRAASSIAAPDNIFTELPGNLPPIVAELAREVTAGTTNTYDAAIALQDWFQGEFDYSLEVQEGHGSNVIESFLTQRVGYCEQFSATFAAMARTLGIPTRVAVGFTPGLINESGWYSVIGRNAHAWPEVWFDDIGWVAFEPTPGRGAPGAEGYTGLPEQQDTTPAAPAGGGGDEGGSGLVPQPTTPPTVVPPSATTPDGTPVTTVPGAGAGPNFPEADREPTFPGADGQAGTTTSTDDSGGVPWRSLSVVAVLLLLLAGPELARRWRTRVARAHGPGERVQAAWARARSAAERAGVVGRPSMTAHEWAAATAAELPVAARPMQSLANVVDQVTFAPIGSVDLEHAGAFGSTLGHDCELWSRQVDRIAGDTLTVFQRARRYFTDW